MEKIPSWETTSFFADHKTLPYILYCVNISLPLIPLSKLEAPCDISKHADFYGVGLSALYPMPPKSPDGHPLLNNHNCLFNIFTTTLHILKAICSAPLPPVDVPQHDEEDRCNTAHFNTITSVRFCTISLK